MRKIKFRAWDSKFKNLIYSFPDGYSLDLECNVISDEMGVVNKDWIIEQSSELTDCEGKEIYEGDILVIDNYFYKVIFIDGMFAGRNLANSELYYIGKGLERKVEVYGNIHQNGDLLK